jgi:LysM repeat protein
MSMTIDKIKKAMEQRKASETSLMEENQFRSAKQFMIPKRTVLWIFLMQFIWVIILGGFFYVNIEKDSEESFNKIKDKLDQLENKFDPINDQLAKVEEAMRTGNQFAPRAVIAANQPMGQGASPSTRITPLPFAPHKKLPQLLEHYHKVERGETLYRISKRYGMSVEEIRRLNKLENNQDIQTGQKLIISNGNN